MAVSLRSTVARLEAENAALRATSASPLVPSVSLCRAILKSPAAIQRKLYIERSGKRFATSLDVELWLEDCREAIGLV